MLYVLRFVCVCVVKFHLFVYVRFLPPAPGDDIDEEEAFATAYAINAAISATSRPMLTMVPMANARVVDAHSSHFSRIALSSIIITYSRMEAYP